MSPVRFWVRPPFFVPFFRAAVAAKLQKRLANRSLPQFFVCRLIALQIPGVRSLRRLRCAPRLRLRCSRTPLARRLGSASAEATADKPATIFVVYASPRDWLFCFYPHDPTSKTGQIPPFLLSDTAPKPRNRYLSQLFRNGVVSTPIFDTGHNTLIINTVFSARSDHYATRANGVGRA